MLIVCLALGVILFSGGLACFLLPFSLADSAPNGWRSSYIIALLVVGFVMLIAFGISQRFISPKPLIPSNLLITRTVLGTCFLAATWQVAYYCWASYFSSYLQVVYDLTITQAGWILGIYDIVAGLWLLFVGWLIRYTLHYKWLYIAAVPLYTLGVGLMIYFRQPHWNIGFICMTQVFIAFAGSTLTLCQQVSVMAAAEHSQLAALLAVLSMFGYIGGSIGNAISGAIWTNTFPQKLRELLPADLLPEADAIYGDLEKQLSYEVGSAARTAIIDSYAFAQQRMLIAGTVIMVLAMVFAFMIKDIKLTRKQTKGIVL